MHPLNDVAKVVLFSVVSLCWCVFVCVCVVNTITLEPFKILS